MFDDVSKQHWTQRSNYQWPEAKQAGRVLFNACWACNNVEVSRRTITGPLLHSRAQRAGTEYQLSL